MKDMHKFRPGDNHDCDDCGLPENDLVHESAATADAGPTPTQGGTGEDT